SRLGRAQLLRGGTVEGIATLESAMAGGGVRPLTLSALGGAQLSLRAGAAAERNLTRLGEGGGGAGDAHQPALAPGRPGKVDAALTSLDRAVALGFHDRGLADGDADLQTVRGDPRYARLFGSRQP